MSDVAPRSRQDDLALAQQRLRCAETVRDVARAAEARAAAGEPLADVLDGVAEALMEHYGLAAVWFMLAEQVEQSVPDVRRGDLPPLPEPSSDHGTWLWAREAVALLTLEDQVNLDGVEGSVVDAARGFMRRAGYGSIASAPLGAGARWLGQVRAARTAQPWTEVELDALGEVGREIGQLVADAQAEMRDRELVGQLRAKNAYTSDLVATVAHELKSPLAALLANLELLDGPQASSVDRQRVVGAIHRATQRMGRILDDLQLLGTGEGTRPAPVELGQLLRDVCEVARDAASVRGQRLALRVPAAPLTVTGDATALDRAVTNLVDNAIKYSSTGTSIRVSLRRVGSDAVISVADEGIGISAIDQPRIFTEFYRSADPRALAEPGTGLGLAIAHRIVERHHGVVEVDSEPGRGATFRLRIPLEARDDRD